MAGTGRSFGEGSCFIFFMAFPQISGSGFRKCPYQSPPSQKQRFSSNEGDAACLSLYILSASGSEGALMCDFLGGLPCTEAVDPRSPCFAFGIRAPYGRMPHFEVSRRPASTNCRESTRTHWQCSPAIPKHEGKVVVLSERYRTSAVMSCHVMSVNS